MQLLASFGLSDFLHSRLVVKHNTSLLDQKLPSNGPAQYRALVCQPPYVTFALAPVCHQLMCMSTLQQFPAIYEDPVIRHIHHSTHKLDDLAGRIAAHFRDSFVCGEEVVGTKDGTPMACRVIAVHEAPPVEGVLCALHRKS